MLYNTAARLSGKVSFPNLMEFGCIGSIGVENNKDRPSECSIKQVNIQLINVNECEQENASWCEHLSIK